MTLPALRQPDASRANLAVLSVRAEQYVEASRSPSTRKAYASDWRMFTKWCADRRIDGSVPTDPLVVVSYLADQATALAHATLSRRLSAIRYQHHQAGLPSPTDHPQVAATLAGIRRQHPYHKRQARPIYFEDLTAIIEGIDNQLHRAVLLVGWWGAFRRSELVGLNIEDLADDPQGSIVTLRRSKTDQTAAGRLVPLHYHETPVCPVRALRALCNGRTEGPVFRRSDGQRLDPAAVSRIVKAGVTSIGLDPDGYSAHSLRAGFVSECDRRGIHTTAIRSVTGHKTEAMLAVYTRPRALFESSAGAFFNGNR